MNFIRKKDNFVELTRITLAAIYFILSLSPAEHCILPSTWTIFSRRQRLFQGCWCWTKESRRREQGRGLLVGWSACQYEELRDSGTKWHIRLKGWVPPLLLFYLSLTLSSMIHPVSRWCFSLWEYYEPYELLSSVFVLSSENFSLSSSL